MKKRRFLLAFLACFLCMASACAQTFELKEEVPLQLKEKILYHVLVHPLPGGGWLVPYDAPGPDEDHFSQRLALFEPDGSCIWDRQMMTVDAQGGNSDISQIIVGKDTFTYLHMPSMEQEDGTDFDWQTWNFQGQKKAEQKQFVSDADKAYIDRKGAFVIESHPYTDRGRGIRMNVVRNGENRAEIPLDERAWMRMECTPMEDSLLCLITKESGQMDGTSFEVTSRVYDASCRVTAEEQLQMDGEAAFFDEADDAVYALTRSWHSGADGETVCHHTLYRFDKRRARWTKTEASWEWPYEQAALYGFLALSEDGMTAYSREGKIVWIAPDGKVDVLADAGGQIETGWEEGGQIFLLMRHGDGCSVKRYVGV